MFGIENYDGPIIAGFLFLIGILEAIGWTLQKFQTYKR